MKKIKLLLLLVFFPSLIFANVRGLIPIDGNYSWNVSGNLTITTINVTELTASTINATVSANIITTSTLNATSVIQLNGNNLNTPKTLSSIPYLATANTFTEINAFPTINIDTIEGATCTANGINSIAIGNNTIASANYSTAMGYYTIASGIYSFAIGGGSNASGIYSIAMGHDTIANNQYSIAIGRNTTASAIYSTAMGRGTTASGTYSTAMNRDTTASGLYSTAMGRGTIATGNYSTSMGEYTEAQAYGSLVIGKYNVISGNATLWEPDDPVFVIGNGTSAGANASNALTVLKNGKMGIGIANPTVELEVSGNLKVTELALANGIVQSDADGDLTSSVTLPDGTLATTQAQFDGSTKLATTAYCDTAVATENIWDRSGTTIVQENVGDNVALGTGFLSADKLKINDTDDSNKLELAWGEDQIGDKSLTFYVSTSNKRLTFESDAVLDQDYTSDASVRFGALQIDNVFVNTENVYSDTNLNLKSSSATGLAQITDENDTWVFKYDNNTNIFSMNKDLELVTSDLKVNTIETYNSINGVTIEGVQILDNDIDTAGILSINTINEYTADTGVTVDSVLCKDGALVLPMDANVNAIVVEARPDGNQNAFIFHKNGSTKNSIMTWYDDALANYTWYLGEWGSRDFQFKNRVTSNDPIKIGSANDFIYFEETYTDTVSTSPKVLHIQSDGQIGISTTASPTFTSILGTGGGTKTFVSTAVSDESEITLPTAVSGILYVFVEGDDEAATCHIQDDGTVTIPVSTGSIVNTDTDTNLCIYDAGTGARIKNRLGSIKTIVYEFMYK